MAKKVRLTDDVLHGLYGIANAWFNGSDELPCIYCDE